MRSMRSINGWLLLALALCGGCQEQTVAIDRPAPALAAFDLAEQPVDLARWRGKLVYLNFWLGTCGSCIAEMPHLDRLQRQYGDDMVVVGVNIDELMNDLGAFTQQRGVHYPMIKDQLGITKERYRVVGVPTAFLIDRQGVVRAIFIGAQSPQQLDRIFADAVAQR